MSIYTFKSNNLQDILNYLDPKALFVFDIDHTLIEPQQSIGSTHWERHLAEKLIQQGFTHHEANIRAFHQWRTLQHITRVQPVDIGIHDILKQIHGLNIPTMGLTARDKTLSELTFDQLASVQLDKAFNLIYDSTDLVGNYPCHFHQGAVFCGFNKKDAGLELFLNHIRLKPQKIIFVDDQQSHVDELKYYSEKYQVDYVGMTYGASGLHRFDPKIAEIQEKHLPKLISDREALDLLEA